MQFMMMAPDLLEFDFVRSGMCVFRVVFLFYVTDKYFSYAATTCCTLRRIRKTKSSSTLAGTATTSKKPTATAFM